MLQGMELDEHYDNTDDMYCDIADRLEAVEAAAPAASLVAGVGAHMGVKAKDGKPKGSGGGGKVCFLAVHWAGSLCVIVRNLGLQKSEVFLRELQDDEER